MTRERLTPGLEKFGQQLREAALEQAKTSQRKTRRFTRTAIIAVVLTLLAGAAAGGTGLISIGAPLRESQRPSHDVRQTPGQTGRLVVTAQDPRQGIPWGAKTYRSASGLACVSAGRVVKGALGEVIDGTFREFRTDRRALCSRLAPDGVFFSVTAPRDDAVRTIVTGRAGESSTHVVARLGDAMRTVPVSRGGAFLLVIEGTLPAEQVSVRAVRRR